MSIHPGHPGIQPQVPVPPAESEYDQKFRKVMARLKGGDYLSLEDGESALITILSDVDQFEEYVAHKIQNKGRALCRKEVGEGTCPYCELNISTQRGLGLGLFNHSNDMIQIIFWTKWRASPLNDIEDAYKMHRVPIRGMQFAIRRRGTGRDTLYLMEYKGHVDGADLPEPPSREAITNVLAQILAPREDEDEAKKR